MTAYNEHHTGEQVFDLIVLGGGVATTYFAKEIVKYFPNNNCNRELCIVCGEDELPTEKTGLLLF